MLIGNFYTFALPKITFYMSKRRATIIEIIPKPGESVDKLLRRYKKKYEQLKVMLEIRERMYHKTRAEKRREQLKKTFRKLKRMMEAEKAGK